MTYIIATIVFALAIVGMAIGVIVSNRRLKGSCGGMAGMRDRHGNVRCDICSDPSPDCAGEPDSRQHESAQRQSGRLQTDAAMNS